MKDFDLLVCVKSYTYLEDATLFQYTISKHRPDKFRFVEFARKNTIIIFKERKLWIIMIIYYCRIT